MRRFNIGCHAGRRALVLIGLGCGVVSCLRAQSLAFRGIAAHSTHSLVRNVLGGEVAFNLPLASQVLSLQIGVAHLVGSSTQIATTCHGFIQQDHCDPEPVAGDASLTDGSLELGVRLWRRSYAAVRVLGGLRLAQVHAANRGLVTDRTYSGSRTWWGGEVGLEGTLAPWARLPVALQIGGAVTRLDAFRTYFVSDVYLPLDVASTLMTARVGVVWRLRP